MAEASLDLLLGGRSRSDGRSPLAHRRPGYRGLGDAHGDERCILGAYRARYHAWLIESPQRPEGRSAGGGFDEGEELKTLRALGKRTDPCLRLRCVGGIRVACGLPSYVPGLDDARLVHGRLGAEEGAVLWGWLRRARTL